MSEIINTGQATPARIYALARLVGRLGTPTTERVKKLLQPEAITGKPDAATNTINEAVRLGLVWRSEEDTLNLSAAATDATDSAPAFRRYLASLLCGILNPDSDNFYLNQFTAWYTIQNTTVFSATEGRSNSNLARNFNDQMYPTLEVRVINETKLSAWRTWATYLGWGVWFRDVILPDATVRLSDLLPALYENTEDRLSIEEFLNRLSQFAPELDSGVLFEGCWAAAFGSADQPHLSLMLSTALRTLHNMNILRLQREADASVYRNLFPAQGSPHKALSHIELVGR